MAKFIVSVSWEKEIEAEDEGEAILQADNEFSFMREVEVNELARETGYANTEFLAALCMVVAFFLLALIIVVVGHMLGRL